MLTQNGHMSGRGKGSKRLRTIEYTWTEGEEVVLITYTTDTEPLYPNCFIVPATRLHKYLALTFEGYRQSKPTVPHIDISLDETDDDTVFEYVKQADVDGTREEQEEEGDPDFDHDVEDRYEILEELAEWAETTLDGWKPVPAVAIKIVGFLKMHKHD